jgi:hypothetical protein
MSVFKVKLNSTAQGLLDKDPFGAQFAVSKQRQMFVAGPNRTYRLLKDGDQFTDCNYWKKFAYPQVSLADAFIEVVTDDGSVFSDVAGENVYPKVYDLTLVGGTTFVDNVADIAGDTGGFATFTQITNKSLTQDVRVRLNGSTSAVFDLAANHTQIFNLGDLVVSKIEFDNSSSGAVDADVQVILSIKSVCLS